VIAAAGSIALASPASAAFHSDEATGQLTFVSRSGTALTCKLDGFGGHDTEVNAYGTSYTYAANGSGFQPCRADHVITITYRDGNDTESTSSTAYGATGAFHEVAEGNVTNIRITHSAYFVACDPFSSATCSVRVTTAPK
jgi:hypothetical protein